MKNPFKIAIVTFTFLSLLACNQEKKTNLEESNSEAKTQSEALVEKVLSKEEQDALTPDQVIKSLKEGNVRFTNNDLTKRDHSKQVRNSTLSQFPKAIVLSCVDSRVPVEDVFDRGIGDLFVARVAGNFVNEDILGSMEFACKISGSKLILVMGHEHCGAIKAAIDDVKLGNITSMLGNIKPAVESIEYTGERTSKNNEFINIICESNVRNTTDQIRIKSPILKEMEANGETKIVDSVYDMDNGKVVWLE